MKLLYTLSKTLLWKTNYPTLTSESVPELDDLSYAESSDEESVSRKKAKYQTKEDEDVAVFLEISKKLSVQSLIFILQNHARVMNIPEQALVAALKFSAVVEESSEKKPVQKIKKFRFAEVSQEKVRCEVHEIPRNDEDPESCWWTQEEMAAIRLEAAQLVRFYKKHMQEFLFSVDALADPDATPQKVEANTKSIMQNENTRGLESHMSITLSAPRKAVVRAVVQEQELCHQEGYNVEDTWDHLRDVSVKRSAPNATFAIRMGAYDHLEALKASISRWRKPTAYKLSP